MAGQRFAVRKSNCFHREQEIVCRTCSSFPFTAVPASTGDHHLSYEKPHQTACIQCPAGYYCYPEPADSAEEFKGAVDGVRRDTCLTRSTSITLGTQLGNETCAFDWLNLGSRSAGDMVEMAQLQRGQACRSTVSLLVVLDSATFTPDCPVIALPPGWCC